MELCTVSNLGLLCVHVVIPPVYLLDKLVQVTSLFYFYSRRTNMGRTYTCALTTHRSIGFQLFKFSCIRIAFHRAAANAANETASFIFIACSNQCTQVDGSIDNTQKMLTFTLLMFLCILRFVAQL